MEYYLMNGSKAFYPNYESHVTREDKLKGDIGIVD